jgi:hypothetical protein
MSHNTTYGLIPLVKYTNNFAIDINQNYILEKEILMLRY